MRPRRRTFQCPGEGYFPDPGDCRTFYRCVDWGGSGLTAFSFQCGEGTVFDPAINVCNHPAASSRPECGGQETEANNEVPDTTNQQQQQQQQQQGQQQQQQHQEQQQEQQQQPAVKCDVNLDAALCAPRSIDRESNNTLFQADSIDSLIPWGQQ